MIPALMRVFALIVCICQRVSDSTIVQQLQQNKQPIDVQKDLCIGCKCGRCVQSFNDVIQDFNTRKNLGL